MPVSTLTAAVHLAPVFIKTFISHGHQKAKRIKEGQDEDENARDSIFFDEAFNIVKGFLDFTCKNRVESVQSFTNTHVPAGPWNAVSPVKIPFSSANQAADHLIDWFGPTELKRVVGGERWWQVRGMDGIDGEWITEKEFLSDTKAPQDMDRKLSSDEMDIIRMDHLESVMLYVHGGGYFWGSINTHRYQLVRYARKMKGRLFAVNYRKAPQYPWPCPLQDVLAAYLYLVSPPPSALHRPVSPSKIVFAGDSAGGALCLTVLTIIRDLDLPRPAGAVLISPWVDLTHSFPSVMNNTKTDIIPPYGFLAKPSTLWPPELIPPKGGRVSEATSNLPPKPGHPDTLAPTEGRIENELEEDLTEEEVKSQEDMVKQPVGDKKPTSKTNGTNGQNITKDEVQEELEKWEPRPPKVLMKDPKAVPLELCSQIQLYATTELQLTHPLVSPVLQGSLGNLPPLYILAGDGEVLRDEIIYMAHKAAHPKDYPTREGVLRDGNRQKENAEKFTQPTKVHLQVFDDMCHVLTVFTFTKSAKYAYRSIAQFAKHVTQYDEEHLTRNPFPELHRPPSAISTDTSDSGDEIPKEKDSRQHKTENDKDPEQPERLPTDVKAYRINEEIANNEVLQNQVDVVSESEPTTTGNVNLPLEEQTEDVSNIRMIRERVDIDGIVRPMEPKEDMYVLQTRPCEVGLIKEEPCVRWAKGQEEWDRVYKREAEHAQKKRLKMQQRADTLIKHARDEGLALVHDSEPRIQGSPKRERSTASAVSTRTIEGRIQEDRRWGPLDLDNESPPPTAIAKRRDTPEALALLKKLIFHTAPITHLTVPRLKAGDAIRAAFDPHDDPFRPPKQSVSEQQTTTHIIPFHGLRMWTALLNYFMRKSTRMAANGTSQIASAVRDKVQVITPSSTTQEAS